MSLALLHALSNIYHAANFVTEERADSRSWMVFDWCRNREGVKQGRAGGLGKVQAGDGGGWAG